MLGLDAIERRLVVLGRVGRSPQDDELGTTRDPRSVVHHATVRGPADDSAARGPDDREENRELRKEPP